MKKSNLIKLSFLFLMSLALPFKSNGQWNNVSPVSGDTLELFDLHFLNTDTGFVVGQVLSSKVGYIFKTLDGGQNWSSQSFENFHMRSVAFTSEKNGIIAGYDGPSGTMTKWLRTDDQGATWELETDSIEKGVNGMMFLDSLNGFAYGYGKTFGTTTSIMKTSDGGKTWETTFYGGGVYESIYFLSKDVGFVAAWNYGGMIIKTTDGGRTFNLAYFYGGEWTHDIKFINNNVAFAVDGLGTKKLYKSIDGGMNWNQLAVLNSSVKKIEYITNKLAFAYGKDGAMYRSIDGGKNWIEENTGTSSYFKKTYVIGDYLYAVGSGGTVLKADYTKWQAVSADPASINIEKMHTFPNPIHRGNSFSIVGISTSDNNQLNLYDISGEVKFQLSGVALNSPIPTNGLSEGIYFYEIISSGTISTGKLIVK